MKHLRLLRDLFVLMVGVLLCADQTAAAGPSEETRETEYYVRAALRPVGIRSVRWTEGFWADRYALCRDTVVPEMKPALLAPENSASLVNFRIAAGLEKGPHQGTDWSDGDCYKWLEAMAWLYAIEPDPALDREMDYWIDLITRSQAADGYISTQIQLDPKRERWDDLHNHELYNMGHLLTAASVHRQATGKESFLAVALRVAAYLERVFSSRPPALAHMDFNPSHIMGLMDLYRVTGEPRYRNLADIFITMRGSLPPPPLAQRNFRAVPGDLIQDRVPLRRESLAVGHAVTGGYLYCGAADLVAETGEQALQAALTRIWDDMTQKKMYVTGANGAVRRGVSVRNDLVHEAFGVDYDLPPRLGYNETCANIACAMFGWRMLLLTGEARFTDTMERVLYNSMLSAMSLDGKRFCYCNPLERRRHAPLEHHDTPQRWVTHTCYCCPPSVARTLARLHTYTYCWSPDAGLWVNLYGGNTLDLPLPNGARWRLTQTTHYPWDGTVRLEIQQAPPQPVSLQLRIPAWAQEAKLAVNGHAVETGAQPGSYARLERTWKAGDIVTLTLPLTVQLLEADPLVAQAKGQAAIQRGPLIYCLESADLPPDLSIDRILLPRDAQWTSDHGPDLLGGAVVLQTEALALPAPEPATALYRRLAVGPLTPQPIQLVPYYTWNNRGSVDMSVWLPVR